MTDEYRTLAQAIDWDLSESDKAYAKKYYTTKKILTILSLAFVVLTIITASFFQRYRNMSMGITFLLIVAAFLNSNWRYKKTEEILYQNCEPERFLHKYIPLISVDTRMGRWERHFYNVFMAFFNDGDFDRAQAALDAFAQYCTDAMRLFRYELCAALMSYHRGDQETLEKNINLLTVIREKINTTGETEDLYKEALQLRTMAAIMENEDYYQGFEAYADFDEKKNEPRIGNYETVLNAVRRNYFLRQLAVLNEDDFNVERLEKFIVEKGGTSWYCRVVEEDIEERERL